MALQRSKFVSIEEWQKEYGLVAGKRPKLRLRREKVPAKLQALIPYAEFWGVADDLIRDELRRQAPKAAITELKRLVKKHELELMKWLGGPESYKRPSKEFLAFTALLTAADGR